MTKKVTGKQLGRLIEGVLNEKNYSRTDINTVLNQAGELDSTEFQKLSNLDGEASSISDQDFTDIIQNYSSTGSAYTAARPVYDKITKNISLSKGKELKNKLASLSSEIPDFDIKKQKVDQKTDPDSVFQFDLRNVEMSSATPQLSPALYNIFKSLSLEDKTLLGRMKLINQFSNDLMKAGEGDVPATNKLNELGLLKFTQYALVVDYLSTICRQLDSGSGAYMFEVFLGMLAGGSVKGKETTSGGKMGGADLSFGGTDLASGSSKFLRSKSATQAMSGFEKEGEYVHYIVAKKNLQKDTGGKTSSSDVKSLLGLDIYYCVVYVRKAKSKFVLFGMDSSGTPKYIEQQTRAKDVSKLKIPVDDNTFVGTLNFVDDKANEYRGTLEKALTTVNNDLKKGFEMLQAAMDDSVRVKESLGDYSTSGTNADAAAENFIAFRKTFKDVMTNLSTIDSGYKSASADKVAQLEEQKITAKMIQKLIEEKFKK